MARYVHTIPEANVVFHGFVDDNNHGGKDEWANSAPDRTKRHESGPEERGLLLDEPQQREAQREERQTSCDAALPWPKRQVG